MIINILPNWSRDFSGHSRWPPRLLIGWKIGNLWKSSSEPWDGMKPNCVQIVLEWYPLHNSETINVRYLKIKFNLYLINLNITIIFKYQVNCILEKLHYQPSWTIIGVNGHNFERIPLKNYLHTIWFHSIPWFWRRFLPDI
jgi:hypothetical protein